ncbi:MAG: TolC family protein [Thermodesulfobacteriota bacterium]
MKAVWVALLLLAGCAAVPQDRGFEAVRRDLEARAGTVPPWNRQLSDEGTAPAPVPELLRQELTADRAVQIALLNNRRVQAVYEEVGVAHADLVQAGLLANPVLAASVRWEDGGSPAIELAVAESFLGIFAIPLRQRLAAAELALAQRRVVGAVLDLAWEVRATFLRYQTELEQLALGRRLVASAELAAEIARRLHAAGNLTDLDLARERAMAAGVRLDFAEAEQAVAAGRERLNGLLGLFGEDTAWRAAPLPQLPAADPEPAQVERRAIEASLDLGIARHRAAVAAERLGSGRLQQLLDGAGLGADLQREAGEWSAGPAVEVAVPIVDWGQGPAMAAEAELRGSWREYTAMAVEVRAAARAAAQRLMAARQRARYCATVLVPLHETITSETLLALNAMQIGPADLLAAQRQETQARRQAVAALGDYWLARAELEQILNGRLPPAAGMEPAMGARPAPGSGGSAGH